MRSNTPDVQAHDWRVTAARHRRGVYQALEVSGMAEQRAQAQQRAVDQTTR